MQPEQQLSNQPSPTPEVAPVDALPSVAPAAVGSVLPPQKKSPFGAISKKTGIIIAAVAVVLIGGGVAGALWWTSPQKTFDDAMSDYMLPNSAAIKGSMVVTPSEGAPVTIDFDTKYAGIKSNTDIAFKMDMGAININVTGSVATSEDKSVLFKVNDLRKTFETFGASGQAVSDPGFDTMINKIDGKWVEMTQADMKDMLQDSDVDVTCTTDTLTKLITDKSYMSDLSKIYNDNKYLSLKETIGSEKINGYDSTHYIVATDKAKMAAYNKAMENSQLVKDLKKCMPNSSDTTSGSTVDDAESPDNLVPRLEIWVDKWSHKLTKIMSIVEMSDTSATFTAEMKYVPQTVTTPKADTQFKDLMGDLQGIEEIITPQTVESSGMDLMAL